VDIKQDEIKEVKKIGTLNGSEVKLVTLKGGFHIGMGKKGKKSNKSEILAVGSHPALVSHQISKKHTNFEQVMAKNEKEAMPSVTDYSSNLSSIEKNVRGLDIFAMKKNEKIEFQITKHNFEIFSISASECDGNIILEQIDKEGFGNCTNTGACEVECPKGISLEFIARMNREYLKASI